MLTVSGARLDGMGKFIELEFLCLNDTLACAIKLDDVVKKVSVISNYYP